MGALSAPLFALLDTVGVPALAQDTVKIGLIASLSDPSAKSGEAITGGMMLASDEIHANDGLLGKQVALTRRDDDAPPQT